MLTNILIVAIAGLLLALFSWLRLFGPLLVTYFGFFGFALWWWFGMSPWGAALMAMPAAIIAPILVVQVLLLFKGLFELGESLISLTFHDFVRWLKSVLVALPAILVFLVVVFLLNQCLGRTGTERPCIPGRYGDC